MDAKKLIVVYIAGASSARNGDTDATKAWLQVSLSAVCHDHNAMFELPAHDTEFLTFIQHSNVTLPRNGLVIARIAEIYRQARGSFTMIEQYRKPVPVAFSAQDKWSRLIISAPRSATLPSSSKHGMTVELTLYGLPAPRQTTPSSNLCQTSTGQLSTTQPEDRYPSSK